MEPLDGFRYGMRRLASGVSIITSVAPDGGRCGITATAVCSLTAEPPTLAAGVGKETRLGAIVRHAGAFTVNVLDVRHRRVAEAFAGMMPGVRGHGRFAYGDWDEDAGMPILADAAARFRCRLEETIEWSTHLLLIGAVLDVHVGEEEALPLVYVSRRFTGVTR